MVGKNNKVENDDALLLCWRMIANFLIREDGEGLASLSLCTHMLLAYRSRALDNGLCVCQ